MSASALHTLNNKHEYGNASETLELLKPCHKGTCMNCWETFYIQAFHQHKTFYIQAFHQHKTFYIQAFHQHKTLITNDINPLYELPDSSHIPLHTP